MVKHLHLALLILASTFFLNTSSQSQSRPRARDLGLEPGVFSPGKLNAITDVPGVQVGHTTLIKGENIRTGVTAILPHGGDLFQNKVPGAIFIGNAFGKLAGSTQVNELRIYFLNQRLKQRNVIRNRDRSPDKRSSDCVLQ